MPEIVEPYSRQVGTFQERSRSVGLDVSTFSAAEYEIRPAVEADPEGAGEG